MHVAGFVQLIVMCPLVGEPVLQKRVSPNHSQDESLDVGSFLVVLSLDGGECCEEYLGWSVQ